MRLKVLIPAFALISTLSAMAAPKPCPEDPQAKSAQALIELEQRWARALEQRDSAAIDCLLASEFLDSGVNGELHSRAQTLSSIAGRKPWLNNLEDLQVTIDGDAAVVHGINRIADQHKKELARVRFTDVFVYRNGQWKAISGQETLVRPAQ